MARAVHKSILDAGHCRMGSLRSGKYIALVGHSAAFRPAWKTQVSAAFGFYSAWMDRMSERQ